MLFKYSIHRTLILGSLTLLLPLLACSGGKTAGSTASQKCDSGMVFVDGQCRTVCITTSQCDSAEICSQDGACVTPADGIAPPRIASIDGDGSLDTNTNGTNAGTRSAHHVMTGLQITGANLLGATIALKRLDAGLNDYTDILAKSDSTDISLLIDLPSGLTSGRYALSVTNQAGTAGATLHLLQGEAGSDGLKGDKGDPGETGLQGPVGSVTVSGSEMQLLYINNGGAAGAELYYDALHQRLGVGTGSVTPYATLDISGRRQTALTGTATVPASGTEVIGTGTLFTTELVVGDTMAIAGETVTVATITDDTHLTLAAAHSAGATSQPISATGNLLRVGDSAGAHALALDLEGNLIIRGNISTAGGQGNYYTEFTVDGDADTYYPVAFKTVSGGRVLHMDIWRTYSWAAPDTWNTAQHRGGLSISVTMQGSGWGGNGNMLKIDYLEQLYSTMVSKINRPGDPGYDTVFWLRGGGARYAVRGDFAAVTSPRVLLGVDEVLYTNGTDTTILVNPTTTVEDFRFHRLNAPSITPSITARLALGHQCNPASAGYSCDPLQCVDYCAGQGMQMATLGDLMEYAEAGGGLCAWMWVRSNNVAAPVRAFPMYGADTSASGGCGGGGTRARPRLIGPQGTDPASPFAWASNTTKSSCACAAWK